MNPAIRRPLNAGLLLLALTLALGFATRAGLGAATDISILKMVALREGLSPGWSIDLVHWITWFGDAAQRSLIMVGCAAWLLWRQLPRAALTMLVFPALAGATCSMLKEGFGRARPDVVPHLDVFGNLAYPSGHAANAMAVMLLAVLLIPKRNRVGWVVAGLVAGATVGLSRNLLGVHWPSDVLGGLCWGAGWALIGLATVRRLGN